MEDVQSTSNGSKALNSPKTASGEALTESVTTNDVQSMLNDSEARVSFATVPGEPANESVPMNNVQSGLNDPEMPENVSHGSNQAGVGPVLLDMVQTASNDENDPVDLVYDESDDDEGSEHDSQKPEEPEKPLSKKRKRAKATDSEGSNAKKTKLNYGRAVREAVTRNMPSLRTQRKHLDENGNPLSVLAVIKQMTKDVLSPYEKEDWRSRDFAEDDRAEFERVRMMYVNDAAARKYSDADFDYNKIAKKDDAENVERKRWTLEQDGSGDESEGASGTDASEPGLNDDEKAEYDYYDISDSEERRKAKGSYKPKRRRIAKGFYRPKQMKEGTKKAIKEAIRTPPRYLYRASSESSPTKYRSTNGYDSITLHCPAAHVNDDESCHTSMYDIPNGLGEFSEMLGRRFLWHDRRRDEMLSWTSSLLFALVHATGRLAKGQEVIVIHVIDTTKVTTIDGQPVDFHFAPDLLRLLDIKGWYGWNKFDSNNLQRPWFTHEWVTHNVVKSPQEHGWEANIEDMIDQGLYTLLEHLRTPDGDDMRSLYHRCGYTRSMYHRKGIAPTPVTWDHFTLAKRLSRCFVARHIRQEDPYCIPPLHLVIDFLGIEARPKRDEGLMAWIRSNYGQADLTSIEYDRSTRIANNLPEQMQALELSRDACFALGLPVTAGTRVWMADENFNWYGKWLKDASREIKIRQRGKEAGESLLMKEMKRMADGAEDRMKEKEDSRKGKMRARNEGEGVEREGVEDVEKADEMAEPGPGNESLVEDRAGEEGRTTGEAETQDGEGVVGGFDWSLNQDDEDVQMQMAVAASLEPGLLGAAGNALGSPLREYDPERQHSAVRDSEESVSDDDVF